MTTAKTSSTKQETWGDIAIIYGTEFAKLFLQGAIFSLGGMAATKVTRSMGKRKVIHNPMASNVIDLDKAKAANG